jgi:hypothetical protein
MNTRGLLISIVMLAGCGTSDPSPIGTGGVDAGRPDDAALTIDGGDAQVCVDVSSDPNNCGSCGHGCLGGSCKAGVCQPFTLPQTVGRSGGGFALTRTQVYWPGDFGLLRCDLPGCTNETTVVPGGRLWDVNADGDDVYWTVDDTQTTSVLRHCVAPACATINDVLVGLPAGNGGVVTDANSVYWSGAAGLLRCNRDCDTAHGDEIIPAGVDFRLFAGTGYSVLWTKPGSGADSDALIECGFGGCQVGVKSLASGFTANAIAANGIEALWTTARGDLQRCPLPDCSGGPQKLGIGSVGAHASVRLVHRRAFWNTDDAVMTCMLPGCAPTVLAAGVDRPWIIAANETAVAWGVGAGGPGQRSILALPSQSPLDGGASASAGSGQCGLNIYGDNIDCQYWLDQACCSDEKACAADAKCRAMVDCLSACTTPRTPSCASACIPDVGDAGFPPSIGAITSCMGAAKPPTGIDAGVCYWP